MGWLDISTQRQFKPCCKYKNVLGDSVTSYYENPELSIIREQFQQGVKPSGCVRCWDDEASGLPSKRQLDWEYVLEKTPPSIDSIKILSFTFGNTCNLACRTCNSAVSSGWVVEERKLRAYIPALKSYDHNKFYKDTSFINDIKNISGDCVHIELHGGEPFIAGITEHLDFLDWVLSNHPATVSLHYITNATVFPNSEFFDRWQHFKQVDIQLSIDGTDSKFEYIRWPANWDNVYANVKKWKIVQCASNNIRISVSHTVSIFNVYYLPEFVKWCLQNKLGKPYLGMVSTPLHYNIKVLPVLVKSAIRVKLAKFHFDNVVEYMDSDDLSEHMSDTLLYTTALDATRNQCFNMAFPEIYKLLLDANYQI